MDKLRCLVQVTLEDAIYDQYVLLCIKILNNVLDTSSAPI